MANPRSDHAPGHRRRLLIVHASSDLYGSDVACLRVAAAARAAQWEVDIVVPSDGPLVPASRAVGATVVVLDPIVLRHADLSGVRPLLLPARWLRQSLRLRAFARSRPAYDVVHSNCAPTLGGALVARWSGARHVWYVHELFTSTLQRRVFDYLLCRYADAVITCSRAALDQFPGVVRAGHGHVGYARVDVPDEIERSKPLSGGVPVVVCVGRLNSWKGQDVLIAAIARLRSRGVAVRAQLVGSVFRDERQFEQRLRDLVEELGVGDVVDFLGERRDALDIVAEADIAVIPSTRPEPFGMSVVEAMALGRPVVASAAGGPAEIISSGIDGLLVPPGDAVALADALQRLIESPEFAREIGAHAVSRAGDFTGAQATNKVLEVYADVLARGRA
ncbi:MAG: glycosyltransferase [Mycobacteriales bacterium]